MPRGVNSPVRAFKSVGKQPIIMDFVKGSVSDSCGSESGFTSTMLNRKHTNESPNPANPRKFIYHQRCQKRTALPDFRVTT
ncbi:hypothetical protein CsSME_00007172 [Camellia sinensis var. sinensis]